MTSKVIKELCIKHPGKKQKDPLTIHVIGDMSKCMADQSRIVKCTNLGAPVVIVIVNNHGTELKAKAPPSIDYAMFWVEIVTDGVSGHATYILSFFIM